MIKKTSEVGQGDLFLVCDHGSLVDLCIPDYKSLCAAIEVAVTAATAE